MVKEMICISCPIGCALTVEYDEENGRAKKESIKVSGNTCPRGIVYAENEIVAPKRMVTTTVKLKGGGTIAVKTDNPVPKGEIFAVLKKLEGLEVSAPVKIGQPLYKNVCGDVNIVATQNAG